MKEFIQYAKSNGYIDENNNITGSKYSFAFIISLMADGKGINDVVKMYKESLDDSMESKIEVENFNTTVLQIFDLMRRDVDCAVQ